MSASENGNGNGKPITLQEMRKQTKLLREQVELKRLQREQKLLENLSLWDSDDWWGPGGWARFGQYGDNNSPYWRPLTSPQDRRHGNNFPLYSTEIELDALRQKSRILCTVNTYARALLRNMTNYVVSKGFSYKAQSKKLIDADPSKPGSQEGAGIKRLVAKVQDVIDRFLMVNRWNGTMDPRGSLIVSGSREREYYRRVKRDGEAFVRFYPDEDAKTLIVRAIEPEQVRQPPGAVEQDGWSFGIQHKMEPFEDVESPEQYHLVWADPTGKTAEGEYVESQYVLHLKGADTDAAVKRGMPEFSWDVAKALDRAAKLQHNLSLGAAIRAATAEIWEHSFGAQADIQSLANQFEDFQRTDPFTGDTESFEKVSPGQIRRIPAGQKLVGHPADQTGSYVQGVQGDLRQASAAFSAPEYWTGDSSNGNYSSLETASAPAVKNGETEQEYFKSAYGRAVWKAVEYAVECGELPEQALTLVELQVEGPAVLHRNQLEAAQVRQIDRANGALSVQTWCAETGRDYELEQANIDQWTERNGQQPGPLDQGDGMPGPGGAPAPPMPGGGAPAASPFGEARLREEGSYFADCPRDDEGHCKGSGGGAAPAAPASADPKPAEAPSKEKKPKPAKVAKEKPRVFTDGKDAKEWGQQHFGEWASKLEPGEVAALKAYQSSNYKDGYLAINGGLRRPPPPEHLTKTITDLDAAIGKATVPETVEVYRGITRPLPFSKGDVFTDKGFLSTSGAKGTAGAFSEKEGALMHIRVPKGANAAWVDAVNDGGERELLLPRGSKFKVLSVKTEGGRRKVELELIHEPK